MRNSILLISLISSVLVAQPSFSSGTHISGSNTDYPLSVFAIDLDSDGDVDILSASYIDKKISWFENDGAADPSFTFHGNISPTANADGAYSVYATDIDNDGDIDVLSASAEDDRINWYENNGSESFTERNITTSADGAQSVYAADIDSDGDIDVLSASFNDDKIAWYENDGAADPSFTARTITTSADAAKSVYAIDLDGDGDIDVLSASMEDDKVVWYENDGAADPSFTARTITTSADGAKSVFAADVDGDGDIDVLSASMEDDKVVWYENDGAADPAFTASTITSSADRASSVYATDIDNDGDIDVLSASSFDDKIAWYENNGAADPSFTAHTITTSADGAASVFAADLDSDGDIDVLSASLLDDKVIWYENNLAALGTPTFTAATITTSADGAKAAIAADMDNDGDLDIVSASVNDDTFAWYENNGAANPSFTASNIATNLGGAVSVFVADMNNDGHLDIVRGQTGNNNGVGLLMNNGAADPSWTASDINNSNLYTLSVYAADMDNDGDKDIVSASFNDDKIAWFENDGAADPSFTAANIATSADGAYEVVAADMDNDGDMDIVSASGLDNAIAWYENDGNADPSWTAADIATSADFVVSIVVADMDNDGDMDIVSASVNDDAISWYENNGAADPSWTAADIATSADGARGVFVADMDNDGDLDILSASENDDAIAWYKNDGAADPSWTAADIATNADGAQFVFAADMDSDGDLDILSASENDDKIAWYKSGIDNTAPTISSVSLSADNATIAVTMSEAVYNTNGGSGALEVSDFALSISGGAATLSSTTPTSISISGNVYTLGIGLSGIANGSETITVTPVDNGIYDAAGNEASTSQSNNTAALNQRFILQAASKEHATTTGTHNSLVKVDDDTYALAFEGGGNNGKIRTFTIPADGSTITQVANLEHDTGNGEHNSLVKVDDDTYVLAYSGAGDDGFITTFTIPADGSTITKVATLEYNTGNGQGNSLVKMDEDTYALAYRGPGDDGFITTFTIPADGSTITEVATLEHDGVKGKSNSLVQVDNDTYALAYQGPDDDGFITTFTIPADGSSITEVATLEHDTNNDGYNSLVKLNSKTYALAYKGANNDGYFTLFEISANGATITKVASLEFDTDDNGYNSLEIVDANTAALAYAGTGSDGYIKTFTLVSNDDQAPTILSVSLASDNSTLAVTFSEAVFNTDGGSGALEANDFAFSISGGTASLSSATPSSISASGNIYTLGIGLSGTPNGSETLTVKPVDNGIYDAAGNEASTSQSNNTVTLNDKTAPTVTYSPAHNATGAAVDRNITITFNEAARKTDDSALTDSNVDALITLKTTNSSGSDIAFEATIDTDKKVITINPTSDFSSEQVVYVAIGATVEDANDNAITASSATFTVLDVNATSVTFSPADGAKDISASSNVTITFDEAVRKIDDSAITDVNVDALITLKSTNASGDDIGFDATINSGKTVITVNPTNDFTSEQVVYAAIGATVEDDANNAISATSVTFTVADVMAPATPTGVAATVGNSKVVLAWNANSESDLASYKVYGGTSASPTTVLATVTSGQTYTHSSLTNGTTYYYRISAVDNAGNESDKTSDITAVPASQKYAVKKDGTGDYTTIQAGITAALTGDTILVYEDTYEEHIDFGGKDIIVTSNYITTNDTLTISNTIIKGTTTNAVVIFSTGNSTSGTLNGFTVTSGKGIEWTSSAFDRAGGGIYVGQRMSPTISNCFIRGNTCADNCAGAGIMVYSGSPTIENCIIENNTTEKGQGGGIYIESGSSTNVKISRTLIRNNKADFEGGGIFSNNKFELINSYVINNQSSKGKELFASAPIRLIHSTLYNDVGLPNTDNSMVYMNQVDLFMINSIVWSTTSLEGLDHPAGTNTVYYVYNSIWSGSQTTNGTNHYRNENPYFAKNTLRVPNYSNAIGKGSASVIDDPNGSNYSLPTIDYFGTTRPYPDGTNPDIGAYEDSLGTPFVDTTAPTVTLSPANGAAAVSVNSNITITFNEAVRNIDDSNLSDTNIDGLITLKENNDSGADISFDATINDGKTIITINPVNNFTNGQVVYVSIGATLEDYSDNATAAASSIFSTIDNVAPAITITPSDGATEVAKDANITIAFSEPIRKIDDSDLTDTNVDALITLKETNSDGADISFDATVNTEKITITVNPTANFSKGQIVYVRIDALVEDSFDNAVSATNSIFTVIENQRPIAGTIRDGLLAEDIDLFTSTTSISANWDPFVDDGTSITYEYAIGKNLTSLNTVADWTSTGTDTFMTKTDLTIEANIFYYVSVRGTDAESLVSDTVTTDGQVNTVDTEVPTVTSVAAYASKEASIEMSWSAMTDSLTVRAVATDNIGVTYFKFAVGSGQEKNNVADWTQSEDSVYSFTGLTFTDGSTYQTWARAYDATDNVSVEVGSNTFQIDASGPVMGIVNDGGSEDVDLIETSTDFSLSWAGFDDGTGIGIESYEFSIGTTKGGVDILNFVNAGLVNTYSVSPLNLVHGGLYYSSVKAVDKLGNWSALASSDGFTLDEFPGPASIVSVSPAVDTNLGLISNPKITFQFSENIQSADVSLTSPLTGTITHTDIITTNELEVTIDDNLASRDEVTLILQNVDDLAGVVSEMAEYKFNTSTLADFNDDGTVNAADLSALITAWNAKDYTKELAPTTGTPPNLIPSPDAKYNLRDAMAFTRMWQWSKAVVSSKLLAKVGLEPTISQNGKSLEIVLPANTVAGELQINYPSGQITLEPSDGKVDDKILALSYNNAEQGRANIAFADREGRSIDKRVISINTKARNAIDMDLIYMFYDKDGLLLGQGTVPFGVTPIPDAFALSYNYPNPFNPITTIEYDLPKDALVKLVIYDMLGREILSLVNENFPAGYHSITWDAKDRFGNLVSAGIYFYQFQTKDFVKTRKMVLLK